MKGRMPLYVLLAGALTFLASLFLPWREMPGVHTFDPGKVQGLLTLFAGGHVDGWVAGAGDVAVLLVVAIVVTAIAALRRPQLAASLPLGRLGVGLGYFAIAVAVEVHTVTAFFHPGGPGQPHGPETSWAYGVYLGVAGGGVAALGGLALRRNELTPPRAADAIAGFLGLALLVSFLLPWIGFRGPSALSYPGMESAAAAIAALGLILGARWLGSEAGRPWRLPFAMGTAILTGAAASDVSYFGDHRYGTWIGVGCAVSLVAVEAARAWPLRLPAAPHGLPALRMGAATLLIVALFLPWEEIRGGPGTDGWSRAAGVAAGSLCLLLLATSWLPTLENYLLYAVGAIVLLVSAVGTGFRETSFFHVGYGAFVGFAAAGLLLVTALVPLRTMRLPPGRALARAVPLVASVLCVAAFVVPWWFVLPRDWTFQASPLYGWMAVAGLLVALYLVRSWAVDLGGPARTGNRLTLVPLTLLALPSLELVRFRNGEVVWGAVILVGLCVLLAAFGWIEESGGLESFRVPDEIWRVDRLPGEN